MSDDENILIVDDTITIRFANVSEEENARRLKRIGEAAGRLLKALYEAEAEEERIARKNA